MHSAQGPRACVQRSGTEDLPAALQPSEELDLSGNY